MVLPCSRLASTTDKWPVLSHMLEGTNGPKILMPELQNN